MIASSSLPTSVTHQVSGFISRRFCSVIFSGALGSAKRDLASGPALYFAPLRRMTSPQSLASIVNRDLTITRSPQGITGGVLG